MEDFKTIFKISYEGIINKLTLIKKSELFFEFKNTKISSCSYDEEGNYIVIHNNATESKWVTNITEDNIRKGIEDKIYATTLDDALKISAENQARHYPKGRVWLVEQYWDDYPDKVIAKNLSFKEAKEIESKYNNNRGYLYYYEIRHQNVEKN